MSKAVYPNLTHSKLPPLVQSQSLSLSLTQNPIHSLALIHSRRLGLQLHRSLSYDILCSIAEFLDSTSIIRLFRCCSILYSILLKKSIFLPIDSKVDFNSLTPAIASVFRFYLSSITITDSFDFSFIETGIQSNWQFLSKCQLMKINFAHLLPNQLKSINSINSIMILKSIRHLIIENMNNPRDFKELLQQNQFFSIKLLQFTGLFLPNSFGFNNSSQLELNSKLTHFTIQQLSTAENIFYSFHSDQFPRSIELLDFSEICSVAPLPSLRKLNRLEVLKLPKRYNHSISPNSLPESIKTIVFGSDFNCSILSNSLPQSLKLLIFDSINSVFNQKLYINSIPQSVELLEFGSQFNRELDRELLPKQLKSLKFGKLFNQSLGENILPESLESLSIGEFYTIPLESIRYPSSLRELSLWIPQSRFRSLSNDLFPFSLISLKIHGNFYQPIHINIFPQNLLRLSIICTSPNKTFQYIVENQNKYNNNNNNNNRSVNNDNNNNMNNNSLIAVSSSSLSSFPKNLQYLSLSPMPSWTMKSGFFPDSLKELVLGSIDNPYAISNTEKLLQSNSRLLEFDSLPKQLNSLILGIEFYQQLFIGNTYQNNNNNNSHNKIIPPSLKYLQLESELFPIPYHLLPESLVIHIQYNPPPNSINKNNNNNGIIKNNKYNEFDIVQLNSSILYKKLNIPLNSKFCILSPMEWNKYVYKVELLRKINKNKKNNNNNENIYLIHQNDLILYSNGNNQSCCNIQ